MADTYLKWWTSIEVDLRKSLVINAMRDHGAMHSLIRTAFEAGLSSETPPSPSTAPEVDDPTKRTGRQFMDQWNAGAKEVAERQAFEGHERGSNLRRVGEGQYENPCVQSAWEGWQARSALASRPAEVDDEGLPELPKKTALGSDGNIIFRGYTAEQYRHGQRDAVAADRARRGGEVLPAELFDGHAVYSEITRQLGKTHCHSHETVSATLDAVVRLLRAAPSHTINKEK